MSVVQRQSAALRQFLALHAPLLERMREILAFAGRRAEEVRLRQVAASLTFTTLLSLVPVFAVALSILTAFPLFGQMHLSLERQVGQSLLPDLMANTLLHYLDEFAAKAARLSALGLVLVVITAMSTALTIDRVLNDIWRVRTARPLAQRLLIYWTLITVGPLLIAISVSATSYLASVSAGVVKALPALARDGLNVLPLVLGGFAYAALYVLVPNRLVLWRDALVGGFIASACGEVVKMGFTAYMVRGNWASVYGAFATLPLFLMWIYLSWLTTLFGAAISATLPVLRSSRWADESRAGNAFLTAVAMLRQLLQARVEQPESGRVSLHALSQAVGVAANEAEGLLLGLERQGYVARLDGRYAGDWMLACAPENTTLVRLFESLAVDPRNALVASTRSPLHAWMREGLEARWLSRPLAELLAPAAAVDEQPGGTSGILARGSAEGRGAA